MATGISRIMGARAEEFFMSKLNNDGIPHTFVDSWYDILLTRNDIKVEVKSCMISVKTHGKERNYQVGRFDFTEEDNRVKQYNENIWVAFICRAFGEFVLCGLCKSKKLKKARYISLHKLRRLNLVKYNNWKRLV